MMEFPNILKGALFNTATDETQTDVRYARGVVVGAVSCLMAQGKSFEQAMEVLRKHLPDNYNKDTIPPYWEKI